MSGLSSKTLSFLLHDFTVSSVISDQSISHLTNNSRDIQKNTLFIAYPGEKSDGRDFISNAIEKGAVAIVYDNTDGFSFHNKKIPCFAVSNLKIKQAMIAERFYDFPMQKLSVIGVTGTNGKTSVTHFIAQAVENCGVIGTVGYGVFSASRTSSEAHASARAPSLIKTSNTTPDGLQLQKMFSDLVNQGAKTVAMEVSSHALVQHRVDHISFSIGVFTNLTQDHLDYHGTMEDYRDAKELLFKNMSTTRTGSSDLSEAHASARASTPTAIINIDDDVGKYFTEKYRNQLNIITYSLKNKNADIVVTKYTLTENGFDVSLKSQHDEADFHLPLIGEFNIYNALATAGVLIALKMPFKKIISTLSQLQAVPGRMQLLRIDNKPTVIVDYAHTPDALEKVLQSMRAHCAGKLICVFGCGGDRDATKRPIMGEIADRLADYVILTNDNPRSENPDNIIKDIKQGMKINKNEIILDRVTAIEKAINMAHAADWVLIAGKGHETEQIMQDTIQHHDDVECAKKALEQ